MVDASSYRSEEREIENHRIRIVTYKIGIDYYCHVENIDPGATIARSQAHSAEKAEERALEKALKRLQGL